MVAVIDKLRYNSCSSIFVHFVQFLNCFFFPDDNKYLDMVQQNAFKNYFNFLRNRSSK